jgi:hypothetical protein
LRLAFNFTYILRHGRLASRSKPQAGFPIDDEFGVQPSSEHRA